MSREPFNAGWAHRAPLGPFAAVDAASAALTPVTLPHDALRDAERSASVPGKGSAAYYPAGAFTYLKTFDVPAEWSARAVSLEFQGAFRHAMVFVNDEFAGNRADGYARFHVDITPFLRYGAANEVRVEVRSGQDSRWYSGAGLHRPVFLHVNDPVHIVPDGVRVTTVDLDAEQAKIEVATTLTNRTWTTASVTLSTSVEGEPGLADSTPVTLAPGETTTVRQWFHLEHPALWSVDSPNLYVARSGLGDDPVSTRFGIRTVQVDPRRGLRINGEPVLLRGACLHHDNGLLGAAAIDRAEERRIELLKAAGFNAIRTAHNPASPAMLDACDRLGMLVMDEAFDQWVRGKTHYDYSLDFAQWWQADLESLVAKDYNHPSVIFYSIGNEIVEVGTPHGSRLARQLAEHVRSLDPTRLITNGINPALAVLDELPALLAESGGGLNEMMADMGDAMNHLGSGENVTRRTAESSAPLDVLGLNYAEGRYSLDRELFPNRVIVGSETFPTRIGSLWPSVLANPNVIGDFTWTGWDYLGEVGIGATAYAEDPDAVPGLEREYPYLTAWCGDLDLTGFRRPVSYYREIVFGLRSEPYLAVRRPEHHGHTITMQSPWAWSDSVSAWTWPGFEGRPITVEVYADADEVVLLVEGVEVGRAVVGGRLPLLAEVETVYRPGELVAVALRDGVEVGRTSLSTAGEPTLVASADRTALRADDGDLAFIALELVDASGRLVSCASAEVTVEVSGAGVLAGFGSANPKTAERFDAVTRWTFDGRGLAIVRPTGEGAITVEVSAPGFASTTLHLSATNSRSAG